MSRAALAWAAIAAAGAAALPSGAQADGYPPFYGYSGYFGGPAVYYTRAPDVQQTTRPVDGYLGFGVVTYTTGGPFWGYKPSRASRSLHRVRYRERAIRVRG